MTQRQTAQRLDLRVRAEFPSVQSEIYELGSHRHVIYAPQEQLDARKFASVFRESYRGITDQIEFSNNRPSHALRIDAIRDDKIGADIDGLTFTEADLATVLAGKFSGIPNMVKVQHLQSGQVSVSFESDLPDGSIEEVRIFLESSMRGQNVVIATADTTAAAEPQPDTPVADIINAMQAVSFKPITRRTSVPEFVREEEEWWFASLEGLFEGRISPRSFDFMSNAGMACYIHSTTFPQIDIRQLLLAYDTIYLEPPLEDGESCPFWESQEIDKQDLLKLVEKDRVRILHSQPEERSDLGFLREAREANQQGVIGRRKASALMIADVVETSNEYVFAQPNFDSHIRTLIARIAADTKRPVEEIARLLLYPVQARRECLQPILDRGLMAYHAIGQGESFAQLYKSIGAKDVSLEAGQFGSAIHTAHMLDATYIPQVPHEGYVATWIEPARFMADRLNFYRSFNNRIAAKWAINEHRKEQHRHIVPPIPLFQFNPEVPLDQILDLTSTGSATRKARSLISRLSELPDDERNAEIQRLTSEWSSRSETLQVLKDRALLLDAGINITTYALGVAVFPLVPVLSVVVKALEAAKRVHLSSQ